MKKSRVQNSKSRVRSPKSEVENRFRSSPPNSKPKTESQTPKTENRKPKIEVSKTVIFGTLPVIETLRANARKVEKILIAEGAREKRIAEIIDLARAAHVPFQKVGREVLAKLVERDAVHQGVVAFTAAADYADAGELLSRIAARETALVLILDGVEDPRNLGAILRSAECAGVDGTFIPEHRAASLTETVVKTSAGATEYAPIAKVKNLNRLIEELKSNNIWVIGTSGDAQTNYTDWDWTRPSALVLGSEGKGLHRLVAENCDVLVKIPMQGKIESLNVSVAAGVILFEAVRQRAGDEKRKNAEKGKSEV